MEISFKVNYYDFLVFGEDGEYCWAHYENNKCQKEGDVYSTPAEAQQKALLYAEHLDDLELQRAMEALDAAKYGNEHQQKDKAYRNAIDLGNQNG